MTSRVLETIRTLDKKQYLPSEKDLECEEVGELSNILKEDSDVKTLTNILAWQERNIRFWDDRWYMYLIFFLIGIVSIFVLPAVELYIKIILTLPLVLSFVLGNVYIYLLPQIPLLGSLLITLWFLYWKYPRIGMRLVSFQYLLGLAIVLGGIISLLGYLVIKYRTIKRYVPEFKLVDTFEASLPVKKILQYRLAVCRDYAKLTAALLFSIYPEKEVYFIEISSHVATGVKIEDRIYVLDQKLPVTTLERWMSYWKSRLNKKSLDVTILKAIYQEGGIEISYEDKREVKNFSVPIVDVNSLTKRLLAELDITEVTASNKIGKPKPLPPLKDMALKYEHDEIVEYSMVQSFKNKILDEFCGNIKRITNVEVQQDGKDIILIVYYS